MKRRKIIDFSANTLKVLLIFLAFHHIAFAVACFSLFTFNLFAQSITWQWLSNDYNSWVNKVQQTYDGGYIAVGEARINNEYKIRLLKFNLFGDTLWKKTYGIGSNHGYWVEQTLDSGFIIGGSTDSGFFNNKVYLIKTDKIGNIQWHKTYSNSNNDVCLCVKRTVDGGYILSNTTWPNNYRKTWILKIDENGNTLWNKYYSFNNSDLVINEVCLLNYGFILVGFNSIGLNANTLLIKLNKDGDSLFSKTYGGNNVDIGNSIIAQTSMNRYVIVGSSKSFSQNNKEESYLIVTDTNGIMQFQRTYSNLGWESSKSIRSKQGFGYILAGESDSLNNDKYNAKIRAIDLAGNSIFETSFHPGVDDAGFYNLELTQDGGFILGGIEISGFGASMYVVKTDSNFYSNPIGIINNQSNLETTYKLYQNYPNPFNSKTKIKFDLTGIKKNISHVKLLILNILGQVVEVLIDTKLNIGKYEIDFNADNLASGIYFYQLTIGNYKETKKMLYIR